MSRMKLLLDVIEDIRSLADSLQAVATALGQSDPEDAVAPDSAPEMPPAPAPADPPPKTITLEEVRAVLAERSHDARISFFRPQMASDSGIPNRSGLCPVKQHRCRRSSCSDILPSSLVC